MEHTIQFEIKCGLHVDEIAFFKILFTRTCYLYGVIFMHLFCKHGFEGEEIYVLGEKMNARARSHYQRKFILQSIKCDATRTDAIRIYNYGQHFFPLNLLMGL